MKKLTALALALLLAFSCTGALAAGKLKIEQENFWVTSSYNTYCYAYAKVVNAGDKAININAGLLEVYDEEGDPLNSTDSLNTYPRYLEPGETGYVEMYVSLDSEQKASDVDDYLLTVTAKGEKEYTTRCLPCTTDLQFDVKNGYSTYDYMYGTIENDTDETLYDFYIVLVLLDDEDNVLYIDSNSYSSLGIEPGSKLTYREYIDSSFKDMFKEQEITPTKVDAIAYVRLEK